MTMADRPVLSSDEADALATSMALRARQRLRRGRGHVPRQPGAAAGVRVQIDGVGQLYGGVYTLSATSHVYRVGQGYETRFAVTGALAAQPGRPAEPRRRVERWGGSVVVGIVTQNADPDGIGRVRVPLPGARRRHRGLVGADRLAGGRQRARPPDDAEVGRRGAGRVRARRRSPPVRARLALERQRHARRRPRRRPTARSRFAPTTRRRCTPPTRSRSTTDSDLAITAERQAHAEVDRRHLDRGPERQRQGQLVAYHRGDGRPDDQGRQHHRPGQRHRRGQRRARCHSDEHARRLHRLRPGLPAAGRPPGSGRARHARRRHPRGDRGHPGHDAGRAADAARSSAARSTTTSSAASTATRWAGSTTTCASPSTAGSRGRGGAGRLRPSERRLRPAADRHHLPDRADERRAQSRLPVLSRPVRGGATA